MKTFVDRRGFGSLHAVLAIGAIGLAIALGLVLLKSARVTAEWTTAPASVPLSPETGRFVLTVRGGALSSGVSDRPTRFEVTPSRGVRIVSLLGGGSRRVDVNGSSGGCSTSGNGSVIVVIQMDQPGTAQLTATDLKSGTSVSTILKGR